MLAVENLNIAFRRYAGLLARNRLVCLRGISLFVNAGEVLAIVGASGAGKSLLAQALLGILPSNAEVGGSILFNGSPLSPERQATLRGREIALVPQSVACLDPLAPVGRQVRLAARRAGIASSRCKETADRALSRFGLGLSVGKAFPHQLSGGMARRVLLAMATVADPALIIADEPTTGLDPDNAATVLRHLRMLADDRKGVLLISHDIRAALPLADRVAVVRDGAIVETVAADRFRDGGTKLATDYARALWRALPENDFCEAASFHVEGG
ncbi:MAG TPA: ABC transporter ATP-binding protein [Xanthobacteraceae bacterium]|nr:ABC transporter ATP-binding protein [Xanthobacteraceae bacterium]